MLGFLNAIGRTPNATRPWFLSGSFSFNDNASVLSVDFKNDRYAVKQQSQSFQETFTYSRSTIATYIDGNGVLQNAAINEPRFARNPINGVTSYYHEGEATNLILGSTGFTTNWSKLNCSVVNEEIAPDGLSNATRLEATSTSPNASRMLAGNVASTVGSYTVSAFVKKGNVHAGIGTDNQLNWVTFDLDTGEVAIEKNASGVIEPLSDGWYRISATFETSVDLTDTRPAVYIADGGQIFSRPRSELGDFVYVWGVQFESGSRTTSYIATTPATLVTRAADTLTINGSDFVNIFNPLEGTTLIRYSSLQANASEETILTFDDGSINNRMEFSAIGGEGFRGRWRSAISFADQANLGAADSPPFPINSVFKYKDNDYAVINDDKAYNIDTSGSVPNVDRLIIGGRSAFSQTFFGWIETIAYYPVALDQTTIRMLAMPDYAYLVDGDSYAAGAGGVGLSGTLSGRNFTNQANGVGGSTLEQAVQRIEANPLRGRHPLIFIDGSVNGNSGVIATEIAKYQRIIDATNSECVIISPTLYPSLASSVDGQFTLDLTSAMLLQSWSSRVVDATEIARTLSGVSFTDINNASDAGYSNVAYNALFQSDNLHPEQIFMDAIITNALAIVS